MTPQDSVKQKHFRYKGIAACAPETLPYLAVLLVLLHMDFFRHQSLRCQDPLDGFPVNGGIPDGQAAVGVECPGGRDKEDREPLTLENLLGLHYPVNRMKNRDTVAVSDHHQSFPVTHSDYTRQRSCRKESSSLTKGEPITYHAARGGQCIPL